MRPPRFSIGQASRLLDGDEQIGVVLRTRDGVRPLFVSFGHKLDLPTARELTLACCTTCRIPEPAGYADIEAAKLKKLHAAG